MADRTSPDRTVFTIQNAGGKYDETKEKDSSKIFESIMKKPITYVALSSRLSAWKKKPDVAEPKTLVQQIKSISATKKTIVEGEKVYKQSDLEKLRDTLKDFLAEIELRLQPSP